MFLSSPNYTIEEKLAYVENYLCGLQLSLVPNLCCSHDIELNNDHSNYFERGKHANEFHNKINDPLYVPRVSKLHDPHSYIDEFASSDSNYYERGSYKFPPYTCINNLYLSTDNNHGYTLKFCNSVIYKMPMHRKKVRLRCHCFHILCCFLPCFDLTIILIGMSTPWDPGI